MGKLPDNSDSRELGGYSAAPAAPPKPPRPPKPAGPQPSPRPTPRNEWPEWTDRVRFNIGPIGISEALDRWAAARLATIIEEGDDR